MNSLYVMSLLIAAIPSANAAITQATPLMDDPVIRVLAGEQKNGTVAFEGVIARATIAPQQSLINSVAHERFFPAATGAGNFSAPSVIPESAAVLPTINRPIPSVTAPVPEPEAYALLALGLAGLFMRKKKRI